VAAEYTQKGTDTTLLNNSLRALNYWLDNDWTASDCLQDGGSGNCPCGTPGLWNKNWFDQVIAVPQWIGNICMLLRDELTSAQKTSCTTIQHRAFIVVSEGAGTMSPMTGANLLDVSSVGINLGLFNNDTATLATALNAFYSGVVISDKVAGDGIQADGSFMQHLGLLYTGNYGKDYINDLLNVFVETAGTNLEPSVESQQAFVTLMQGTEWMMVGDSKLQKLLWQYSTIGRMISFRYSDGQASGGVDIDVNEIEESGEAWSDHAIFENITDRLSLKTTDANQGSLTGTRYFYNADYMVNVHIYTFSHNNNTFFNGHFRYIAPPTMLPLLKCILAVLSTRNVLMSKTLLVSI
jgi:hypothetical protein